MIFLKLKRILNRKNKPRFKKLLLPKKKLMKIKFR